MSVEAADRVATRPGIMAEIARKPGFLMCLALLAVFATAFQVLTKNMQFRKLPLPLKKPLDQLDVKQLAPYQLEYRSPPIKSEVLDELGTNEYIQWAFSDTSITDASSPERLVNLFVTYYTGKPDQVPHVPEKCYLGSGYRTVSRTDREVSIPALGPGFTIPVQVLEFERSALFGQENKIVIYTFNANGQFVASRGDVQAVVGNPLTQHAYFSKLELTFGSRNDLPSKERALQAGDRFLQVIVPRLVKDHWPDWETKVESRKSKAKIAN